jgi:hypothetical protein
MSKATIGILLLMTGVAAAFIRLSSAVVPKVSQMIPFVVTHVQSARLMRACAFVDQDDDSQVAYDGG